MPTFFAPESATNSLSSGFIVVAAGKIHPSESEKNVVFIFWAHRFSCQVPRRIALVLQALLESVLKFHGVGTSLMRNFDLYFTKRWTIFLGCLLDAVQPSWSYSSNWSQQFCALPRNRCRFWRLNVLWYTTQLSLQHFCHHFCSMALQPSSEGMSTQRRTHIPISFHRTDNGRIANTHKTIWCKHLSRSIYTAVDWTSWNGFCLWHSFSRHTSTSCFWRLWLRGWCGFWCRLCTIVTLMPETTMVSLRTLSNFFPLVTGTFSSFNVTFLLSILDHCSCFNSQVPGVKVS